ncbi:MAG: hypothetical protein HOJ65_07050, partial [Verrucomicrobia bacterium]|nr:hypothetical protein [Verrucomicrobiota bacterium]
MLPRLSIPLAVAICALPLAALGQTDTVKPAHDPPGQLFRHAPMSKATRSIIMPLSDIRFAFDTENLRVHTVWRGKLDLYGPQHVNAKRPFIAQPNGEILWGNPPTLPWRTNEPSGKFALDNDQPTGKFIGTSTDGKSVTLRYALELPSGESVSVQLQPTISSGGVRRTLTLSQCRRPLFFLANSFVDGDAKLNVTVHGSGVSVRVIDTIAEQHWVLIPPHDGEVTVIITTHHDGDLTASPRSAASPLAKLGEVGQSEFKPRAGPGSAHYKTEYLPLPPELDLLITGMDWIGDGRLAVCTWPGE